MRVSEVAALKIADVDSGRMVMRIERGKGGKEGYVMLSEPLLAILRSYWSLQLLTAGAAGEFSVSWARAGQADRTHRSACGLPLIREAHRASERATGAGVAAQRRHRAATHATAQQKGVLV